MLESRLSLLSVLGAWGLSSSCRARLARNISSLYTSYTGFPGDFVFSVTCSVTDSKENIVIFLVQRHCRTSLLVRSHSSLLSQQTAGLSTRELNGVFTTSIRTVVYKDCSCHVLNGVGVVGDLQCSCKYRSS